MLRNMANGPPTFGSEPPSVRTMLLREYGRPTAASSSLTCNSDTGAVLPWGDGLDFRSRSVRGSERNGCVKRSHPPLFAGASP